MSVPVLRLQRSLAFGIGLAAFCAALRPDAPTLAASATLQGAAMPAGFGRLSITFDEPTTTRLRVSNGVLTVAFDAAVTVDVAKIARELPDYISVARVDPDLRGMRFALSRPYKANLIEAGDKVFIDLLPETWKGLLPGPPPEVVAALAQRLRVAEAQARDAARKPRPPIPPLTLRSAKLPTLQRLMFKAPDDVVLTATPGDGTLSLIFDRPLTVEPTAIRLALPEGVALASAQTGPDSTRLEMTLPKGWDARSFRDEDGLVVDLLPPAKADAMTLPGLQSPAAPAAKDADAGAPSLAAKPAAPANPPPAAPAVQVVTPKIDPAPQAVKIVGSTNPLGSRLEFRFPRPTGAAGFVEAGLVTMIFDTKDTIDPASFKETLPLLLQDATVTREAKVTLVRLKLASQQLVKLEDDGMAWSLNFGEQVAKPSSAVAPRQGIDDRGQTIIVAPLPGMTGVHWIENGPGGMSMAVATALGPVRSVAKPYRYVEFELPQTVHGVVVTPRADDVVVKAGTDQVQIGRAGGLTVTPEPAKTAESEPAAAAPRPLIEAESWNKLRMAGVRDGERALQRVIADASRNRKSQTRLDLARFYAANGLMPEASGPLKVLSADDPAMRTNREVLFLKGLIALGMHRNAEALTALAAPQIAEDAEADLWRGLAQERLNRHGQAMTAFRRGEPMLDRYPDDLQALLRPAMARAALATQDLTAAERQLDRLGDLPAGLVDGEHLGLLRAMLDDASGRVDTALNAYKPLFDAVSRPVAAEAQLLAVKLVQAEKRSDMTRDEMLSRLETVSVIWRGGQLEVEALSELGRLYADQERWRDAFQIAKRANETFPDDPLTRRLHDETARRFAELFSTPGKEQLPRIDALALFYDFKEFLPVGRRGDEIIRLLADRLVELDLLDQAGDILRYQMDKRLTGAARSTLATRVAMISLMNNKPADALRALAATRLVELPADVRRARLLLEAKTLSDLSRTDQALDLLESERGPEVDRLRSDVYWTGRRWREAGEAHERLLGEAWRGETQLTDGQRADVMRAAISYVMSDEALSLDRLRTKFAGKMAQGTDARTFAFVTGANRAKAADIREMARAAVGADTLGDFMQAYRERYPAYSSAVRVKPKTDAPPPSPTDGAAAPEGAPAAPGRG